MTKFPNSQQCSLSNARGADNGDKPRGRFIGEAVDERNMKTLFFDLFIGFVSRQLLTWLAWVAYIV